MLSTSFIPVDFSTQIILNSFRCYFGECLFAEITDDDNGNQRGNEAEGEQPYIKGFVKTENGQTRAEKNDRRRARQHSDKSSEKKSRQRNPRRRH